MPLNASRYALVVAALASVACTPSPQAAVSGPLAVWQTLTLEFHGPAANETDDEPNPFLDYRLQVEFSGPSGKSYSVPGYFDGDGQGGEAGDVWRARFTPDEAGAWTWKVSFRNGPGVAVELDGSAGEPAALDGAQGEVTIAAGDPNAEGFAKWGRLSYAGGHYLKFADGPYWIRGGTDSPENFLGYEGFGNTKGSHQYAAHVDDWSAGDPDWGDGRGKAIVGALNYLSSKKVNSIYMLTMNIGGDGDDVWPWAGQPQPKGDPSDDNLHFDVSKLSQWETVFAHAQRKGLFLHLVLNEAEEENKRELDDGELGVERKLYYRELVARFSHHLAMQWNICEEFNIVLNLGPERVREFARYIEAVDPYDHPVTVHTAGDPVEELRFLYGDPLFSLTSIQLNQRRIDLVAEAVRSETEKAGRPLPISLDEFTLDVGQDQSWMPFDRADRHRKEKIWPTYMSGGMIEFILEGLLSMDNFKEPARDELWTYLWHARKFMEENLPFWEMSPADELVSGETEIAVGMGKGAKSQMGAQVFAKPGEVYAAYFPSARRTGSIDLSGASGELTMRWYNPRTGMFEGAESTVQASRAVAVGSPPSDPNEDWTILISAKR